MNGLACLRDGRPHQIDDGVWVIVTKFKQMNVFEIGNNAVMFKVTRSDSSFMVVVNMVQLSSEQFQHIKKLCEFEKAPIKVLFSPGDFHHFYITDWQREFPEAKTYVVSERVFRQNKDLDRTNCVVVDRHNPTIEGLENDFELVPVLGALCKDISKPWGPFYDRCEVVVLHKKSKTLFITDHAFPRQLKNAMLSNFGFKQSSTEMGVNKLGFQIGLKEETKASMEKILSLDVERIVFSHLKVSLGSIDNGPDIMERLRRAYESHYIK